MAGHDAELLITGLRRFLADVESNRPAAIAGDEGEALHDLRVGVRRTRAALKHSKGVFRKKIRRKFGDEFSWLQDVTGAARDYEVWMSSLPADDPLRLLLAGHYDDARQVAARALESERTGEILATWGDELRNDHDDNTEFEAVDRIDRQYQRVLAAAVRARVDAPALDLHRLRKRAKELRYLLELFPTDERRPMRKALKRLQDSLGAIQDSAVQRDWLVAHADDLGVIDVRLKELDERDAVARIGAVEELAQFLALGPPQSPPSHV